MPSASCAKENKALVAFCFACEKTTPGRKSACMAVEDAARGRAGARSVAIAQLTHPMNIVEGGHVLKGFCGISDLLLPDSLIWGRRALAAML